MSARFSHLLFTQIAIALSAVSVAAHAGEFDVTLEEFPQTVTVNNPGPAVAPTVYIVGRPDRSVAPVRKTKGIRLGGVRLTETLLSESVLILYPDGTGRWGYHAGFDIFREPQFKDGQRIDPRTLVEYDKWRFDPLLPVTRVGGDMNLLRLYPDRGKGVALYEVAFPPPIRIRKLRVTANCDGLSRPGVVITTRLFSDRRRSTLVAEKKVGLGHPDKRFPIEFTELAEQSVFVELSGSASSGVAVDLYWTMFEATLDTTGLELPMLTTGRNQLRLEDDPDSSHQARVVLRWEDRPPAEQIWDDFESTSRWSNAELIAGGPETGLAFTGQHFARATLALDGRDKNLYRAVPSLDFGKYNRLGIASRVVRDAPGAAILLGIKNGDSPFQYVRPKPGTRWRFESFDISHFQRDNVTAVMYYWTATPGYERPDDPCVYDIDSLCLWHEEPEPPRVRKLPPHIADYVSPSAVDPSNAPVPVPPIQEWFPMGFYDGICSRSNQECEWLFDQMKRLHMNTVYISNGTLDGLQRILPLAESRGIRLIYQGGGDGSLYCLHLATRQARLKSMEGVVLPAARQWIPRFRGRPGLVAWSLTEEIDAEIARELGPYYQLVRELAPEHAPTVLHNNLDAARADLATNRPLVVTHDFYPFFWSPRSGPSNPRRSLSSYRGRVSSYYRACREHDASLWMMPQAWGEAETAPLDPPHYGYRRGMRTPEPGEIKLQGWVAVAEGATGIMFYAALANRPNQEQLWSADWKETANTRAAGELFEKLSPVTPLLCRLERDYKEEGFVTCSNSRVLAHSFIKRKAYEGHGRYIVCASLDGFGSQRFQLSINGPGKIYDMIARREIHENSDIELKAGEGSVFLVGSESDFQADCKSSD